jgi:alpha-amylase/alpha-mannosidase (GH57 family)
LKAFAIHGHFYQPPRENPWLKEVELQRSAAPHHDWNEKITRECYMKNTSNYPIISYNFGPTLLNWMRRKHPETYSDILKADWESIKSRGHGNALAQAYNHIIMPLASFRSKEIQVVWGIRDFQLRFLRDPEGMWLPEMAVDLETLSIMAKHGIKFTILAPHQIEFWKALKDGSWAPFTGTFYPLPLRQNLPNGRHMDIFIYHRGMGEEVSFGPVLQNHSTFLGFIEQHLLELDRGLLHFATDGETFGHHKKNGSSVLEMTLRELLDRGSEITNYSAFLEACSPDHLVQIRENTSWSCPHGIERWRRNCGCSTGGDPTWNQEWRGPLREAMSWLKEKVDGIFEVEGESLFKDPWGALMDYIEVLVEGPASVGGLLSRHQTGELVVKERVKAAKLLEMEYMSHLMFTSCGWFFSDISGAEAVQNIRFAARTIELAQDVAEVFLEGGFLDRLCRAKSNVPTEGTGLDIYKRRVLTSRYTTRDITAHYLMESILKKNLSKRSIFNHNFTPSGTERYDLDGTCLCMGKVNVEDILFTEEICYFFVVLQYHHRDLYCNLEPCENVNIEEIMETLRNAYLKSITLLVRRLDQTFSSSHYNLEHLITLS